MKAFLLALMLFTAPASPAGLAGDHGNVNSSPYTGDIWGTELVIRYEDSKWSGTWRLAESFGEQKELASPFYNEETKLLRFRITDDDGKTHSCVARQVYGGILFKLDEKNDRWQYLRSGNRSAHDYTVAYITQAGAHLKKTASDDINPADIIMEVPAEEKVALDLSKDDSFQNGYALCTFRGKKGFIDAQFLCSPENQIVTGSNVRLRQKPNTSSSVITTLAEGTAVQIIQPEEGEWIRVLVDGKKGYINYKYVSE